MVDRYLRGVLGGENRVSQGRRERQYWWYSRDRGRRETTVRRRSSHPLRLSSPARSGQARARYRSTIWSAAMTWIETVQPRDWGDELRAAAGFRRRYPAEYAREVESLRELASSERGGGITQYHTLIPGAFEHAFSLHAELLAPDLP